MSSAAATTSAALAERASSVAAIAGMVCDLILLLYSRMFLATFLLHQFHLKFFRIRMVILETWAMLNLE